MHVSVEFRLCNGRERALLMYTRGILITQYHPRDGKAVRARACTVGRDRAEQHGFFFSCGCADAPYCNPLRPARPRADAQLYPQGQGVVGLGGGAAGATTYLP